MTLSSAVGKKIRDLRLNAGRSARWLAERSGVGLRYLLDVEGGRVRPSLRTLQAIARGLGTSGERLVRDAEQLPPRRRASRKDVGERLDTIGRAVAALPASIGDKLEAAEAAVVRHAMLVCGNNKTAAAKLLGIQRKALERRWNRLRRAPRPHT